MKKSEIEVGAEYGYTDGASGRARRSDCATRVKVLEVGVEYERRARSGYSGVGRMVTMADGVRVKFLTKSKGWGMQAKRGEVIVVQTRDIWRPWSEVEASLIAEAEHKAMQEADEKALNERIDALIPKLKRKGLRVEDLRNGFDFIDNPDVVIDYGSEKIHVDLAGIEKLVGKDGEG